VTVEHVDVAIVGAGPSGLAAAAEICRLGTGRVIVFEREREAGGIPRHSNHQGYGLLDLHRPLTGPRYARTRVRLAREVGAEIRVETSVVDWTGERRLLVTGPEGLREVEAGAVVLATGCRERPRSARLIPGSRPAGVFTTGALQQFVYERGVTVGRRAVVVGAEHVSHSALITLAHGRMTVVAMVTDLPRHQTYAPFRAVASLRSRAPLLRNHRVTRILGRQRLEGVEVTDLATGVTRVLECDTLVLTGDWIPDNELARIGGLDLDSGTRGPAADASLRTSRPGVFAVGNLLHGAETADVAALEGIAAGEGVASWLRDGRWPERRLRILTERPFTWVAPNELDELGGGAPPRGHFVLRVDRFVDDSETEVIQGGRVLWHGRPEAGLVASFLPWLPAPLRRQGLVPNLPVYLPSAWVATVTPSGGDVLVRSVTHELRLSASSARLPDGRLGGNADP
jgi:thioredoxin reductase